MTTSDDIKSTPLVECDPSQWKTLAKAYKLFYKTTLPEETYDATWKRICNDDGVHGIGAVSGKRLVGIAHFLFHTTTWDAKVCYLQDLFVAEQYRGQGIARQLIETVAQVARDEHSSNFYWLTQDDNQAARLLYDKLADFAGFIRYDYSMKSRAE